MGVRCLCGVRGMPGPFLPLADRNRQVMPRISAFYGIVIYMYWNEKDHPVAHFHAYHAGRRASVSINGEVLAGHLESRALQFVREWAKLRQDEILANWNGPAGTSHCTASSRCRSMGA